MIYNMDYKEFIQSIIDTRGQWGIPITEYFERHHIVPKCLGGGGNINQKDKNIIWLYPHEHFMAHKLLANENPNNKKLVYAYSAMAMRSTGRKKAYELTPEEHEQLVLARSKIQKGSVQTSQTKQKISKSHKGKICITNGTEIKYIKNKINLPEGWFFGNCRTAQKHSMVAYYADLNAQYKNKLSKSGNKNSMYGHGERVSGGKNGHAIYTYFFEDKSYDCRKELIADLKLSGIIVSEHVIRNIVNNTYSRIIAKKYAELINKLTWRLKKNEN